ncbi:MAG TPA: hypothetical protein VNK95_08575, partial [Caldilineaceae bacterium]|nr:hypothetical protein [Caldilineaceae bacterium]
SLLEGEKYSLSEWQALGYDRHSVFADPLFVDPDNGDYRLRPESPALRLGFESFDIRGAGLRPGFVEPWPATEPARHPAQPVSG